MATFVVFLSACQSREADSKLSLDSIVIDQILEKHYLNEVSASLRRIESQQDVIDSIFGELNFKKEALSIVLPETIRFNLFQDVLESSVNDFGYVNFGSTKVDFSIGLFQMKPSFVEQLESYIISNSELSHLEFIVIKEKSKKESRKQRLTRIKNPSWQFQYTLAYYLIAEHRFGAVPFASEEARLAFYASAYNYGFMEPLESILSWCSKDLFPYGKYYSGKQYPYSGFALTFFEGFKGDLNPVIKNE